MPTPAPGPLFCSKTGRTANSSGMKNSNISRRPRHGNPAYRRHAYRQNRLGPAPDGAPCHSLLLIGPSENGADSQRLYRVDPLSGRCAHRFALAHCARNGQYRGGKPAKPDFGGRLHSAFLRRGVCPGVSAAHSLSLPCYVRALSALPLCRRAAPRQRHRAPHRR